MGGARCTHGEIEISTENFKEKGSLLDLEVDERIVEIYIRETSCVGMVLIRLSQVEAQQ
jgi:hypothetical protein